jgi:hypothetical protein
LRLAGRNWRTKSVDSSLASTEMGNTFKIQCVKLVGPEFLLPV